GYTPARYIPVKIRRIMAGRKASTQMAIAAVVSAAPMEALPATICGGILSGRFKAADPTAPTTKPILTEDVNHTDCICVMCQTRSSAGATAAAENQVPIAKISTIAISPSSTLDDANPPAVTSALARVAMMHSLHSAAPLNCIEQICTLSPFAAYDLGHRLSNRSVRLILELRKTMPSVHPSETAYCRLPISSFTPKVSTRWELIASLLK